MPKQHLMAEGQVLASTPLQQPHRRPQIALQQSVTAGWLGGGIKGSGSFRLGGRFNGEGLFGFAVGQTPNQDREEAPGDEEEPPREKCSPQANFRTAFWQTQKVFHGPFWFTVFPWDPFKARILPKSDAIWSCLKEEMRCIEKERPEL